MIVKCPNCEAKYKLDPAKLTSPEPKIRCKKCNTIFKAVEEAATAATPSAEPKPATPAAASSPAATSSAELKPAAPTVAPSPAGNDASKPASVPASKPVGSRAVVVAHESPEFTGLCAELLGEAGYQVVAVHDGIQALMEIEQRRPAVAILDVALPKMFGFEVIEVVRRDRALDGTKLILVAAIYDKTRYKRSPATLYGADDYIEKHLVAESLVQKVEALVSGSAAAATSAAPQAAVATEPAKPAPASAFDESSLTPQEKEEHEKAKRLARIIVGDIALYNPDALIEGLKKGNPLEALAKDIEDGRKHFSERVPANIRAKFDYLGAALEDLFAKKRKELGLPA